MINVSGEYSFKEDFGYGKDEGIAVLIQNGTAISGSLSFIETIEGDEPFSVICELEGSVDDTNVKLDVISFKTDDVEYFPESRIGVINDKGQIVGSSEDEQGVCGVFIFEPI